MRFFSELNRLLMTHNFAMHAEFKVLAGPTLPGGDQLHALSAEWTLQPVVLFTSGSIHLLCFLQDQAPDWNRSGKRRETRL
jgi:hypothetical protein